MSEPSLVDYARAYNFILATWRLEYGGIGDFVRDDMAAYLAQGFISEAAAKQPIWAELGLSLGEPERVPRLNDPPGLLSYDTPQPPPRLWGFPLVRVALPEGWSLCRGCECGMQLDPSAFQLLEGDQVRATLSYFPGETEFQCGGGLDFLDTLAM